MNKEFDKYIHSVRTAFPFFRKSEKRFFSDFCTSANEYASEHPDCTYEELESDFGNPKDIVIEYYNQMEPDVYFTIIKKTRAIRYITATTILVLFTILVIALFMIFSEKSKYDKAKIDHIDTSITITEQIDTNIEGDDSK